MKLAFSLFKFFPYGGLQRDFLRIANECLNRGHAVDVYSGSWEGEVPEGLHVSILNTCGLTNHKRLKSFVKRFREHIAENNYHAVVGFNKMPGLDMYYAADSCFAEKVSGRGLFYKMTGRSRTYLALERAVFDRHSKTRILLISEREKKIFQRHYDTQDSRFHLLPPGIVKDRFRLPDSDSIRRELRKDLGVGKDQHMVLMVGSGFRTKGVDRAIRSLASLDPDLLRDTFLIIVGADNPKPFLRLAARLGVRDHVKFMGGRENVPMFFVSADLLIHPAYRENTGTVLLEAMLVGLPVLATDICGYGSHIASADAGELVPSPFRQETLNHLLQFMLQSEKKNRWSRNGIAYAGQTDLYSLHQKAVDTIEKVFS